MTPDDRALRYVVLDEQGFYLNYILVVSPYPAKYYPGYGRYIAYADQLPAPMPPANPDILDHFTYLNICPDREMSSEAQMDIQTGVVTPAPPPPPPEEITDIGVDLVIEGLA